MSLTQAQMQGQFSWNQTKAVGGFRTQQAPDTLVKQIALSVGGGNATDVYYTTMTIPTTTTTLLNLLSLTDVWGSAVVGTRAYGIVVAPTGAGVQIGPAASSGLLWFLGGATHSVTVQDGGVMVYGQPTGAAVIPANKQFNLTALGTGALTLKVAVIVGQ